MKIEEICKILHAEWLVNVRRRPECKDIDILSCQASDLMSDVLTVSAEKSLLLTGLTNAQVIRVAEVSDIVAVCFVRGKKPQKEVIQLAEERIVPLLMTPLSMYESCSCLSAKGMPASGSQAKEPM